MIKQLQIGILSLLLVLLSSCAAYFNQPLQTQPARLGEDTFISENLDSITPKQPIEVGVYKFRDQTGQYKQTEAGISYSTAVTQGATSILIRALEESGWFVPVERENVSNLLNERQIIRSTRQQYSQKNGKKVDETGDLPPLLFAGILLEGGIISYDSNIITGGAGARYFGAGASAQYRQDRISIYLRAVSTSTGKVLKTVYVSKTLLSQAIDVSMFRYVKIKRLLEIETGVSQNEPAQLAVKEAIEKAVENLIIEGILDGLWQPKEGEKGIELVKKRYEEEKKAAGETKLFNRNFTEKRSATAFSFNAGTALMDGDYAKPQFDYNFKFGIKQFLFSPKFNVNASINLFRLRNKKAFEKRFASLDANLEYIILPNDNITPYVFGGGGLMLKTSIDPSIKLQYGAGIEYMPTPKLGFRIFGEHNVLFTDELDNVIHGKRDDFFWRFGVGINLYLGKGFKKSKPASTN
ncbi:MAG: hypothetical protein CR989_02000 [Flavobacteriales bacterium]|nr:MAG: hypothetical protein CR989_02000 [Flavobacteriales bacterium]